MRKRRKDSSERSFLLFLTFSHLSFARLDFDLSPKALRHSFAIAKEAQAQRKASLSLEGGGVIQLPGVPVIIHKSFSKSCVT